MRLHLENQVAVIIGGCQGIGLAIAREFLSEQAHVVLVDRDPRCEGVAAQLCEAASGKCQGFVADATDAQQMAALARQIRDSQGRCDHVVYAAGVGSGKFGFPFWNLQPSDWQHVLNVNLIGAACAAHAFAPGMAEAGTGTMLFISSVAGQIGSQTDPPYSAAKAGVINFAQCAAKDLAPYQVRVNTLCPGMIKTTLNHSVYQAWADRQTGGDIPDYETWASEKIRSVVPLGRWQTPEDIAAMAVFLASDRAANVTGQTINVDGGFVMHW